LSTVLHYVSALSSAFRAKDRKNGFAMMALSCLMIESLESFHRGWRTTKVSGAEAFDSFFSRYPEFSVFTLVAADFYRNIRCGILHQGETTGGWRVRRDGPLYQRTTKTVNAVKFLRAVESPLNQYCARLAIEPWESSLWRLCRKKLDAVCRNAVELDGQAVTRTADGSTGHAASADAKLLSWE
jgi:hypothetical protein